MNGLSIKTNAKDQGAVKIRDRCFMKRPVPKKMGKKISKKEDFEEDPTSELSCTRSPPTYATVRNLFSHLREL